MAGELCVSWSLNASTVLVHQADEAEGGDELLGEPQLGRRAEIHRQAVVDQEINVQIFFFEEQADEELVQASEKVPVEMSQVVANDVILVVGKLDRLALALGEPFAFHPADEDLPRHQLELFEPGQEARVQKWCINRICHPNTPLNDASKSRSDHLTTGDPSGPFSLTSFKIAANTWSEGMFSAWASKLSRTRCRMAGR
jgi:hypothetical protein